MFTLEQINDIHVRFGNAESLSQYLEALENIGVEKCDSFITDGHSEYFGKGGYSINVSFVGSETEQFAKLR